MQNLRLTTMMVLVAAACGDDNMDDVDTARDNGEQLGEAHADDANNDAANLPDEGIVAYSGAVVLTIDEGEIMHASFALDAATDPAVIAYAEHMLEMHTSHAAQTAIVLAAQGVEPLDNPVAATLGAEAMANLDLIQRAADVNYEYMRVQLMMHAEAFVIVDALVDLAPNDQMSQFLADTRQVIALHRGDAEDILRDEL